MLVTSVGSEHRLATPLRLVEFTSRSALRGQNCSKYLTKAENCSSSRSRAQSREEPAAGSPGSHRSTEPGDLSIGASMIDE